MKKKIYALIVFVIALFICGSKVHAKEAAQSGRAYLGVRLALEPLDELLIKHLRLEPEQGLVIKNVQVGSPADKAQLERDDIVISIEGKNVFGYDEFVENIQNAGVGAKVSLKIIHLGERRVVDITLEAFKETSEWKYPLEPRSSESWHPGRMFRLRPGDGQWQQIPFGEMPKMKNYLNQFFQQKHYYHTPDSEESYEIIIEGDPQSENATVTVRIGTTEYKTTISEIDSLPEQYRQVAREAVEEARKSIGIRPKSQEYFRDDSYSQPWEKGFFDRFHGPRGFGDDAFDQMERQMFELRNRMKEMEESHRDLFERFDKRPFDKESVDEEKEEL